MPRRTQEDSQETRKKILESAQRLFTRRGYERTSLSDIAKYAGVTRGAIYWHFENKEELLVNMIDFIDSETFSIELLHKAAEPTESDPLSKLKTCINKMVQDEANKFFTSSLMSMIVSILNGSSGNNEVRDRLLAFTRTRHELLIKIFKNCIAKGQLPANLSVNLAVEHLSVFCAGYIHQTRMHYTENLSKKFDYFIEQEFEQIKRITTDSL